LPADTYRVIGNLPYNISTPLLFYLMEYKHKFFDLTFMLQKEVAERITAVPNNKNYGRLSIMLQYHCKSELLFDVSPEAFYPKPKVTSSVIRMIPYSTPPIFCKNYALLEKIVATAFNQRRKTIHNSLKTYLSTENFVNLGLDPKLRAENCSLQNFVDMVNFLHSVNKPSK
jgi:16S rRNA (adenine1518-N6/adenine1519-N6)-dimethyltransferase